MNRPAPQPRLLLPNAPALVAGVRQAAWLSPEGEIESLSLASTAKRLTPETPPVVCHAKATAARLGVAPFAAFDVLELFAFVRPARFVLPTPRGLAQALGLALPGTQEREAESLLASAGALLAELADGSDGTALKIAAAMASGGWPWGPDGPSWDRRTSPLGSTPCST